jgi:hypothetical protein
MVVKPFVVTLERSVGRETRAARLAEIHVAGQIADDQDVEVGNHFRLERRRG